MKIETLLLLNIITPTRKLVEGKKVAEIVFPAARGEIGLLSGHLPFLGFLGIGHLHYKVEDQVFHTAIRNGFAEFHEDQLTVLAEEAALPNEIDPHTLREELVRIEHRLGTEVLDETAFAALSEERRWLSIQIDVSIAASY
ncbi:MAG: F0F1 ATP synthase subunit epsilon [Deltaproteobacteria bacterium]|nr:F0F1 ATP synthase subunit epsilon [Deltaproteobacteria bacterium]